jgi:hypothetical protein
MGDGGDSTDGSIPGLVSTSEDEDERQPKYSQRPQQEDKRKKEEEERRRKEEEAAKKKKADAEAKRKADAEKAKSVPPKPEKPRINYDDKKALDRKEYPDIIKICGSKPDKDKCKAWAASAADSFDAGEPNAVLPVARWGPAASRELQDGYRKFQTKNEAEANRLDEEGKELFRNGNFQNGNYEAAMEKYERARRLCPREAKHHANFALQCMLVTATCTGLLVCRLMSTHRS